MINLKFTGNDLKFMLHTNFKHTLRLIWRGCGIICKTQFFELRSCDNPEIRLYDKIIYINGILDKCDNVVLEEDLDTLVKINTSIQLCNRYLGGL